MRRGRIIGIAFVGVVACLLVSNLRTIAANQSSYSRADRPVVCPRGIVALAAKDGMGYVRNTIGTYHRLRELLAGKTVVVSQSFAHHGFFLERVSRLHVEVVPERYFLAVELANRLHEHATHYLRLGEGLGTPFDLIIDEAAMRYVLVERPGGGLIMLLPEAQYLEASR